jgi:hypothetical protein
MRGLFAVPTGTFRSLTFRVFLPTRLMPLANPTWTRGTVGCTGAPPTGTVWLGAATIAAFALPTPRSSPSPSRPTTRSPRAAPRCRPPWPWRCF